MRAVWMLLLTMLVSAGARADVLILKDGSRIEGDVKRTPDGYDVVAKDGKITQVSSDKVASIQIGKSTDRKSGDVAKDRLASLRRSVEGLSDIGQIIERYRKFIEQNPDTPAAADAVRDLATWQDRLDRGLIKVAGKWISPEERAELAGQTDNLIAQAQKLLKENRQRDAEPLIRQALDIDPTSENANYLNGVLLYRQDKLHPARKSFEAVLESNPDHPASLNNLGVILFQQNQVIGAMAFYDRAMVAMPRNKEILNNVTEALQGLTESNRKQAAVSRAARRYAEQEQQLQTQMAQYGWYRWGSTWVDQSQLDRLKATEKDVREKMDKLQEQFDSARSDLNRAEEDINRNNRIMTDMDNSRYYRDASGRMIIGNLPAAYYELRAENDQLQTKVNELNQKLADMRTEARRLEIQLPTPKFTGVQQIIGVEGLPRAIEPTPAATTEGAATESADPTTQPAAAPTTPPTTQPTIQPSTQPVS